MFIGHSARIQSKVAWLQSSLLPSFFSHLRILPNFPPLSLSNTHTHTHAHWLHRYLFSGASSHYRAKPCGCLSKTEIIQLALFFTAVILTLLGNLLPTPSSFLPLLKKQCIALLLSLKVHPYEVDYGKSHYSCLSAENMVSYVADTSTRKISPSPASSPSSDATPFSPWLPHPDAHSCWALGVPFSRVSICCCLAAKSCPALCNLMDYSLPGSSVQGILQARILEWVFISFSRRSSQPRDWMGISCIGRQILYCWAAREARVLLWCL